MIFCILSMASVTRLDFSGSGSPINSPNVSQITRAHDTLTLRHPQSAKSDFKKCQVRGVGYICLLGGNAGLKLPLTAQLTSPTFLHSLSLVRRRLAQSVLGKLSAFAKYCKSV